MHQKQPAAEGKWRRRVYEHSLMLFVLMAFLTAVLCTAYCIRQVSVQRRAETAVQEYADTDQPEQDR